VRQAVAHGAEPRHVRQPDERGEEEQRRQHDEQRDPDRTSLQVMAPERGHLDERSPTSAGFARMLKNRG
jgi:hypothetical protein